MTHARKLFLGSKLWWINNGSEVGREVTVRSVEGRWVYLSNNQRVEVVEGEFVTDPTWFSLGRAFWSKAHRMDSLDLDVAWSRFRQDVLDFHRAPRGTTIDAIGKSRDLLGLPRAA